MQICRIREAYTHDLELSDTEFVDECTDSDESIHYRLLKRRRFVLDGDTSDEEIPSNECPAIWFAEKDNELAGNPPEFVGPQGRKITGDTPYAYFRQIFTDEIFKHIVQETIRYAVSCGKDSFHVNVPEMKQFFGINIIMTYIKYPNYRLYWSSNVALRLGIIAESMSLKRFEEIKRYLHYQNNDDIPEGCDDIFIKVRQLLDMLSTTFAHAATLTEFQAIDEMIIPYKGRHSGKQYNKSKPKKWGFKAWVRASENGYVSKFEMYQKSTNVSAEFGVIGNTVLRLCEGLEMQNHKLFLDNLFTSIHLIKYLQEKNIYVVGTIRKNRLKEAAKKLIEEKRLKKRERGAISVTTSSENITILRWNDNNIVHMISSYAGVDPVDSVQRWNRKTHNYMSLTRPFAVSEYNRFMGGVDLSDRMIAHYPHSFKNKKFYHRIAFHFLNVSIVNSWILFKHNNNKEISLLEFKSSVATAMIQLGAQLKKRGRPSSSSEVPPKKSKSWTKVLPEVRLDCVGHYPKKMELKNPPRCHDKNCKRRTRYICDKCKEPVCPECMASFHS